MSYDIFKQNMLSYMRNQRAIGSLEDFAKKLVQEYDALVHRGYDSVNKITVSTGNTELMESILVGILNTAFQQSSGEHPLYTNLGPAFQAYWTGATMNLVPPPLPTAIPVPAIHIAQVSNSILSPGAWNSVDKLVLVPEEQEEVGGDDEFDMDAESAAILNDNLEIEQDTILSGLASNVTFAISFDSGVAESSSPRDRVRRNAGQSNVSGRNRTRTGGGCFSVEQLREKAAGGLYYPALGSPGNWEVQTEGNPSTYKKNPDYSKNFLTNITLPLAGNKTSNQLPVHVDFSPILISAFAELKDTGLIEYITSTAGTYNVRAIANSPGSLSNHSWGLAIDLNSSRYPPYLSQFKDDGIYNSKTGVKIRDYDDFDLGYCRAVEVILRHGQGALQWLTSFDPMHISLYECTWGGTPSFVKPFG